MNTLESQLDYPLGDFLPALGEIHEVASGIFWVRMGLPFALNHINLWLLEDESMTPSGPLPGWTVVDCGIANDVTRDTWERIFATQLRGLPIIRVIATHCHPDHVGLADWLCTRWNTPLLMTAGEYAFARMMSASLPGADGSAALPHFQRNGLRDVAILEQLAARKNYYQSFVPNMPTSYERLQNEQTIAIGGHAWRIITGFGHSPEHASLYCENLSVMISGDMVLPRISTNVSVFAIEPEANPLQLYLQSLEKFNALPDSTLILPSHGNPFLGLHTRIQQLCNHHELRLLEVVQLCDSWKTAADVVPVMFRRELDAHQLTFALGEALAHLHKLWFDGVLQRRMDANGAFYFKTS